ncbi:MAG: hypothetical protein KF830_09715 [Planctomycetes bacterium]|nr:hypothetical protein [Planctomycetota bacterium]
MAIAIGTALSLLLVAWTCRGAEVDAENDRYHEVAEQLWQGRILFDRFHPLHYPLLVAAPLPLVGDALLAGCLVSALAAGLLVAASGSLAERLRPGAGTAAALLVAGNGVVWIHGTTAASDLLATTLVVTAAAWLASPRACSRGRAMALGALLGFAVGTRFAVLVTLPVFAGWLWRRGGFRPMWLAAVGALVGYAPNGALLFAATGSPWRHDNWQLVYLKVVCGYDFDCLQHALATATLPTAGAFFAAAWPDVLALGARDLGSALTAMLPSMLGGADGRVGYLVLWPLLLAGAGLLAVGASRRTGAVLLVLAAVQVAATCAAYAPKPRFLLPALPLGLVGLGVLCAMPVRPARRWLAVGLALGVAVPHGVASYRAFLGRQPVAEVGLARRLHGLVPRPMVLLTTLPSAYRYVTAQVAGLGLVPPADPGAAWAALRGRMEATGAEVFLTGRSSHAAWFAQLVAAPVPDDFTVLHRDAETLAVERVQPPSTWIASFTVEPQTMQVGRPAAWTLRLSTAADRSHIVGAGVVVVDAAGAQNLVELQAAADGAFVRTFPVTGPPGTWRLLPFVLLGDARALRGAEWAVEVVR